MSIKIIDLEKDNYGEYAPKKVYVNEKFHNKGKGKGLIKTPKGEKPKYLRENHADEFLNGVDVGLDLIESIIPRIDRFLRLRG